MIEPDTEDELTLDELTLEERVANGWQWLNETVPGWQARVDVNALDFNDCELCICGQVFAEQAATDENEDDGYGFGFAARELFSRPIWWLDALIEQLPASMGCGPEVNRQANTRDFAISCALGFAICEPSYDRYEVRIAELEGAWRARLVEHARSLVGTAD